MTTISRPRVFLEVSIGEEPIGRLVIELFTDKAPKTCENFRQICTGGHPPLTYKSTPFHRVIDEFMIQGGDITAGDGTGGDSIYGKEFADENIGWRPIDVPGLVCMANRGRDTNSSQFFITLAPCQHLNEKHTVFGHLVSGQDTLERMAKVKVDKNDRPLTPVLVSRSGELERKKKTALPSREKAKDSRVSSTERGRRKRHHTSDEESRSRSRSRECRKRSRSRNQLRKDHRSRSRSPRKEQALLCPRNERHDRRRSDATDDRTLRGRPRKRSRSPSEDDRRYRKRSTPPSRRDSRSGSKSRSRDRGRDEDRMDLDKMRDDRRDRPEFRRQRSFPNQYRGEHKRWEDRRDRGRDDGFGRLSREDDGRLGRDDGRLNGGGDRWTPGGEQESGIKYKGRGTMKFRERNRW